MVNLKVNISWVGNSGGNFKDLQVTNVALNTNAYRSRITGSVDVIQSTFVTSVT